MSQKEVIRNKDYIDSLDILEKAELINKKAIEIQTNNRTLSQGKAFEIATAVILKGETWSY